METITDTRTPFEKFKQLAEKLIAVPKKEIDEKQAEYERKKEKEKQYKNR